MNERSLMDWKNVKVGDVILLSDEENMLYQMENGHGTKPFQAKITEIERIKVTSLNNSEWIILWAEKDKLGWFIKIVGDKFDIREYSHVGWLNPDSRKNIIYEQQHSFLYKDVECLNSSEFIPLDELEYIDIFSLRYDATDVGFQRKIPTQYGQLGEHFVQINEYSTQVNVVNYELLVLETGGINQETGDKSEDGGWVTVFEGRNLAPKDVEVLPV